jgi:divalent metal cation (Fe/Co/Zn/Cd) transporter
VFNTLKNQGYEFEHNYGHGKQYLSSTLAGLMLLAFLTDQLQNHACALFKAARGRARVQKKMWETMRSIIELVDIPDWETLWTLIARPGDKKAMLTVVDSG